MRSAALPMEVRRDDRRRLAAELERHWRQIAGGIGHHGASGRARSGEEQMVERQRCEGGAAAAAVAKERELVRGEIFWRRLDQQFGQTPRVVGHPDHRPVACGEDADERRKA